MNDTCRSSVCCPNFRTSKPLSRNALVEQSATLSPAQLVNLKLSARCLLTLSYVNILVFPRLTLDHRK